MSSSLLMMRRGLVWLAPTAGRVASRRGLPVKPYRVLVPVANFAARVSPESSPAFAFGLAKMLLSNVGFVVSFAALLYVYTGPAWRLSVGFTNDAAIAVDARANAVASPESPR